MKPKTARSENYLSFIRSRPCSVTGNVGGTDIVAHHVRCLGGGGVGIKPTDFYCLPLTATEHARLHNEGERSYWGRHGLDPAELITMNVLVYLAHDRPAPGPFIDALVQADVLR